MRIPIESHALENGLRVNLSPDPSMPVVAINLWYNVGSRNERSGRTGFAHLFEHMMFQGSEHVGDSEHIAHVERMGGSVNGSTWLDRTNYFQTVPARYLERVLWLESDRMGFFLPALTQTKLNTQRSVVKNERRWRVDNQPYGDWDERLQAMVFPPDHPYHHSVIGSMGDLDAADLDDVADFFRTFYAPGNAVLTLCGDFEPEATLGLVERYFGSIPAGPPVPPLPGDAGALSPLEREAAEEVIADVGLPRIYLSYRIPPYGDDRFPAADIAAHLFAAGRASRLYASLVRERRIAQDVVAFAFPIVTGGSMLLFWATVSPGVETDEVRAALDAELARLAAEPPSRREMERVITGIESRHVVSLQQAATRADMISMYSTLFDEPERINSELDRYRRVSAWDVHRFAEAFLDPNNRARLTYLPRSGQVAA